MRSPNSRVSAFFASASAIFFWPINAPISFDARLRWALSVFNLGKQLAPLLIKFEQLVNVNFIPCPARGETLADKIRLIANQFNVEHREIIGVKSSAARLKAGGNIQHTSYDSPRSTRFTNRWARSRTAGSRRAGWKPLLA